MAANRQPPRSGPSPRLTGGMSLAVYTVRRRARERTPDDWRRGTSQGLGVVTEMTADTTTETDAIVDRTAVVERFEGDVALMREIADLFLDACPERLQAVRIAVAHRDSKALQFAAHSLKGAVSNFAATLAVAAALRLEIMGRNGDLTGADSAYAALEEVLERLCGELRHLKEDSTPADTPGAGEAPLTAR